ncbi:class F sortase [Actinokineospora guangxiensis]|uniref:Class F sortase n=1 Tax=Actinokineospora guangxiensis TaxID=1490288 RepID=A0ABW0ES43_9PSEU
MGVAAAESAAAAPTGPDRSASPTTIADPTTGPTSKPSPPTRVDIDALGVTAPVVPVGVEGDGLMQIPEDVATVGWYRFGPAPGADAGSAVITGHVNDRDQGLGVFARIGELAIDDTIRVSRSDGTEVGYRVIAREQWTKDRVPLTRLFARDGAPRLVLITCGGVFDRDAGNYQDNIAITAVPTG